SSQRTHGAGAGPGQSANGQLVYAVCKAGRRQAGDMARVCGSRGIQDGRGESDTRARRLGAGAARRRRPAASDRVGAQSLARRDEVTRAIQLVIGTARLRVAERSIGSLRQWARGMAAVGGTTRNTYVDQVVFRLIESCKQV